MRLSPGVPLLIWAAILGTVSIAAAQTPPADAFLRELDASQPIPGTQLIVLSEHVDYWNHEGWLDPYSSAALTERQSLYMRALGLHEAYTPQFIVDGTTELRLRDRREIAQILQNAAAAPKIPVSIASIAVDSKTPASVSGRIEVNGQTEARKSDIYLGLALDHVESKVLRSENRGEVLTHVAVLQKLIKIGTLAAGQRMSQEFRVPLQAGMAPDNVRLIVFAQESGFGKVVGAALERTAGPRS